MTDLLQDIHAMMIGMTADNGACEAKAGSAVFKGVLDQLQANNRMPVDLGKKEVATLFGMQFISDPSLPDDTIRFVTDEGEILGEVVTNDY